MEDEMKEPIQEAEPLPPEVVAFCELLARIMMRCLREKNPRIMELLSLSSRSEGGETHDTSHHSETPK